MPGPLAESLRRARHVAVLTGAGVSAESGLPTFRDALTGLWARHRPEDLATPEAFERDPRDGVGLVSDAPGGGARRRAEPGAPRAGATGDAGAALHPHHPERGRAPPSRREPQRGRAARRSHPGPLLARGHRSPTGGRSRPTAGSRPAARAAAPTCVPTWCGSASSCRRRRSTRRGRRSTTATCFLAVGTSNLVEPAASLPWLAAAQGAMVGVVNTSMEGQRSGVGIHHLTGPAGQVLPGAGAGGVARSGALAGLAGVCRFLIFRPRAAR